MSLFIKVSIPFMILLLLHFFYLNGKKLMKSQNLYRLEAVSFIGVEESDPYELIEALGLEKGINLLFLDTGELTRQVKTIPRYKNAEVHLQYPNTLILKLEEKRPEYIVKANGKLFSVNRNGEITERDHEIKKYDYFFIEVSDFSNQTSDQEVLHHPKFKHFINLAKNIPQVERDIFHIFSGIEFSRYNKNWIIHGHNRETNFNLGKKLTLNKLRKARYAYMYGNYKKISTKNVFITKDLVYFNQ